MPAPVEVTAGLLKDWPLPEHGADKNSSGRVLVVGGGAETPGAVLLAAEAALRAGCGKVQIATAASVATALAVRVPEARVCGLPETDAGDLRPDAAASIMALAANVDVVLLGPGMGDSDGAAELAGRLVPQVHGPVVLDAFATGWLSEGVGGTQDLVATMNPSELAHASGIDDEQAAMTELARRVTVILGGETKLIGHGERRYVVRAGGPGLATAGSGDVQAGLVAGLLARGATSDQAAVYGAWLHASAGDRRARRGTVGFLAREIAAEVPALLDELADRSKG